MSRSTPEQRCLEAQFKYSQALILDASEHTPQGLEEFRNRLFALVHFPGYAEQQGLNEWERWENFKLLGLVGGVLDFVRRKAS